MEGGRRLVIEMKDITMSFGGNVVLDKVSFDLRQGEVHSLMGANGAGKSTLIKILNGIHEAKSGKIFIEGKEAKIREPKDAERLGLAFVHQELNVCPDLSVAENMYVGNWARTKAGFYDKKKTESNAKRLLDVMGIELNPASIVRNLRTAEKQIIEILKTLTRDARVIILDEPTSSLNENEKVKFFEIISNLKDNGVSIIFISHFLEDVLNISDRVSVLKDGANNGEFEKGGYTKDDLVKAMMGQAVQGREFVPFESKTKARYALEVDNLSSAGKFEDVSFKVKEGDIVGVCGLLGAGKTEIARAIFGLDRIDSGTIAVNGKPIARPRPSQMIESKVALLTEERKLEGFVPLLPIHENICLSVMKGFREKLKLNFSKEKEFASRLAASMKIKMTGVEQPVVSLSGGNQQKVVLAKCLANNPSVFLLDEPTRGVDVLAKNEIYKILRSKAEQGTAVIIFSSEIEELLGNCSRILILKKGRLVNTVSTKGLAKTELLKMIG